MSWREAVAVSAITLGCATGGELAAQAPRTAELDRIEEAIETGRLDGVRAELDVWLAGAADASPEDRGRARYLRARLYLDADSARSEYLDVALDGRSSYGALAWLRLAQLDLARGQTGRAIESLERLRTDYSRSDVVAASGYWPARARESGGELDDAYSAFDRALAEASAAGDADIGERAAAARAGCGGGGLTFTLQVGAFSSESAAESLATTARALGYPARVIREDDLRKVRVGRFASADAARVLERRLRGDGFTVTIVAAES
ncbi:MAG: SPOR domain-containing protein [Gemmatimonadota bacterium]|nr:SPOR domain-containing protein [Gemmatimonadota bacterium]